MTFRPGDRVQLLGDSVWHKAGQQGTVIDSGILIVSMSYVIKFDDCKCENAVHGLSCGGWQYDQIRLVPTIGERFKNIDLE